MELTESKLFKLDYIDDLNFDVTKDTPSEYGWSTQQYMTEEYGQVYVILGKGFTGMDIAYLLDSSKDFQNICWTEKLISVAICPNVEGHDIISIRFNPMVDMQAEAKPIIMGIIDAYQNCVLLGYFLSRTSCNNFFLYYQEKEIKPKNYNKIVPEMIMWDTVKYFIEKEGAIS